MPSEAPQPLGHLWIELDELLNTIVLEEGLDVECPTSTVTVVDWR